MFDTRKPSRVRRPAIDADQSALRRRLARNASRRGYLMIVRQLQLTYLKVPWVLFDMRELEPAQKMQR